MRKREMGGNTAKLPPKNISVRRGRGRPPFLPAALVRSCADNYRTLLGRGWNELAGPLLAAETEQEVADVLRSTPLGYPHDPSRLAPLLLEIRRDPKFPKRQRVQINFLADSVAGGGVVSRRRSRDICAEERARDAQRHYIVRFEYWIECSCGYKGHSENHSCKKCGAILYLPNMAELDSSQYL
jgi:hypothetical protein